MVIGENMAEIFGGPFLSAHFIVFHSPLIPSLPLTSPSIPILCTYPLPPLSCHENPIRGSVERCKLPSGSGWILLHRDIKHLLICRDCIMQVYILFSLFSLQSSAVEQVLDIPLLCLHIILSAAVCLSVA